LAGSSGVENVAELKDEFRAELECSLDGLLGLIKRILLSCRSSLHPQMIVGYDGNFHQNHPAEIHFTLDLKGPT